MKNKFDKYKYLGNVTPEVPESWENIILDMLVNIDNIVRPWYIPMFIWNYRLGREIDLCSSIGIYISQIKQKFGTLRVYNTSESNDIKLIIKVAEDRCNNTCEYCGKEGTTNVTIKNWVRNLCPECIEKARK